MYYGLDGANLVILLAGETKKRPKPVGGHISRRSENASEGTQSKRLSQGPQDIAANLNAAIEEFEGNPRLLMKA